MGNKITTSKKKDFIRLISYNIMTKYSSPLKISKISKYLNDILEDEAIICLQNLYHDKSIDNINDIIKNNKNIIKGDKNGLYTISNLKLHSNKNYIFNDNIATQLEGLNKGIIITNYIIKDRILSIYNVSLQNDIDTVLITKKDRQEQMKQLKEIVKNNKIKNHYGIHILVGNFNIDPNTDEYNIIKNNFIDISKLAKNKEITNNTIKKKDDYILLFIDLNYYKKEKYKITYKVKKLEYSCHYPIQIKIKF